MGSGDSVGASVAAGVSVGASVTSGLAVGVAVVTGVASVSSLCVLATVIGSLVICADADSAEVSLDSQAASASTIMALKTIVASFFFFITFSSLTCKCAAIQSVRHGQTCCPLDKGGYMRSNEPAVCYPCNSAL